LRLRRQRKEFVEQLLLGHHGSPKRGSNRYNFRL
jgi:hypothetical protein